MIVLGLGQRTAPTVTVSPTKTPKSTIRIVSTCGAIADQKAKLLVTVIKQLFEAQIMIQKYQANLAKTSSATLSPWRVTEPAPTSLPVSFGNFFMSLAVNTRALGKAEGLLQACTTAPDKTASAIKAQRNQNYKDLVLTEFKLNEAYSARDFDKWLTLRTKIQMYHSVVSKLDGWLSKIAADQAASAAAAAAAQAEAARIAAEMAQTQLEADAAARAEEAAKLATEEAKLVEAVAQEQGAVTESDASAVTRQADGFFAAHKKEIMYGVVGLGIIGTLAVVRAIVR